MFKNYFLSRCLFQNQHNQKSFQFLLRNNIHSFIKHVYYRIQYIMYAINTSEGFKVKYAEDVPASNTALALAVYAGLSSDSPVHHARLDSAGLAHRSLFFSLIVSRGNDSLSDDRAKRGSAFHSFGWLSLKIFTFDHAATAALSRLSAHYLFQEQPRGLKETNVGIAGKEEGRKVEARKGGIKRMEKTGTKSED